MPATTIAVAVLHRRLLRDIAELQDEPYPNVTFHFHDSLSEACLILSPDGKTPLHLKMKFAQYPLKPPYVTIQSAVEHPNVFGDYICASILNSRDSYTPAYTLKSIAIQLLSFFSSDKLEQEHGDQSVDLTYTRRQYSQFRGNFACSECGFDDRVPASVEQIRRLKLGEGTISSNRSEPVLHQQGSRTESKGPTVSGVGSSEIAQSTLELRPLGLSASVLANLSVKLDNLPDEIMLSIFSFLSSKDLWALSQVYPKAQTTLNSYDFIRMRELQCFFLKEDFLSQKLGIGVAVSWQGRQGTLQSEFDLLSQLAFKQYSIHHSIFGKLAPLSLFFNPV